MNAVAILRQFQLDKFVGLLLRRWRIATASTFRGRMQIGV